MTTVNYDRGECRTATGVFKFTEEQIAQIDALYQIQKDKPSDVGAGVPLYQYILDCISTTNWLGRRVARDDVDPAVYAWIAGAVDVNSGVGFYADYIREYTRVQYQLRGGTGDANDLNQRASNRIAFNLVRDVIGQPVGNRTLPSINGLGAIDAGAAAAEVFKNLANYGSGGDYAGWAGTELFPFLSMQSSFYQDFLLSDQPLNGTASEVSYQFKHESGLYDLIASITAHQRIAINVGTASWSNAWQAFLAKTPLGSAPITDRSDLATTTTSFFNSYYRISSFSVGDFTVFGTSFTNATSDLEFDVGTSGDDTIEATGSVIIHAGRGNDTIHLLVPDASAPAVIDGGEGSNRLKLIGAAGTIVLDGRSFQGHQRQFDFRFAYQQQNYYSIGKLEIEGFGAISIKVGSDGAALRGLELIKLSADKDNEFDASGDHRVVILFQDGKTLVQLQGAEQTFELQGIPKLTGSNEDDDISAGDLDNVLKGNKGNDILNGGLGADTLYGDQDADVLGGGNGNDSLDGGSGDDLLFGGGDNDDLLGGDDRDFLNGGMGADKLYGGTGNDYLFDEGGSETNTLKGEAGNDFLEIKGGTGIASLDGGADNDILIGGQGNNFLDGGTGNDSIKGGGGYDIINGGDDADFVDAGAGNDRINGGKGADFLKGGLGDDTYVYDSGAFGVDLIEDGQGKDVIRIAEQDIKTAIYDADKRAWVAESGTEIRKYSVGGSTVLSLTSAGDKLNTIYIQGWQLGQYGLTLSGGPQDRQRPSTPQPALPTRPENNGVDLAYTDAADSGAGNDILRGTDGSSFLNGGAGNDMIEGAGGDDWLEGGDGTDFIVTGEGKDVAYGGIGADVLRAGGSIKLARGTISGTGEPVLYWTSLAPGFLRDDDTTQQFSYYLNGSKKSVQHPELAVFDLSFATPLSVDTDLTSRLWWMDPSSSAPSLEPNLRMTIKLGDPEMIRRDESYTQAPSANFGQPISYTLIYRGDGLLSPGTGIEGARLYGGAGDDILYGANNNDRLYGEDDNDVLVGYDGDDELYGGAGNDELSGGAGRDFLDGGDQDDLMVGGYGADVISGGEGSDKLIGDAPLLKGTDDYPTGFDKSLMGGDYLQGGAGNDSLWGDGGDDYLFGGADNDLAFGGEGDDHLFGDSGADTLLGGNGGDFVDGGSGKDYLYGEKGGDLLQGGAGDDIVHGDDDDDIVDGGDDDDQVFGDGGNDYVRGGAGKDQLYGDSAGSTDGADMLEGGAGDDLLDGGGKGDMYIFSKGDGKDAITDTGAAGDRNIIVFKFGSGEVRTLERAGLDLLIKYGVDDQVTVRNYYGGSRFSLATTGTTLDHGSEDAQAAIAAIQFEDGVVWGEEEILAQAPAPSPGTTPADPFASLAPIYFVNALLSREAVRAAGKSALTFSFQNAAPADVTGLKSYDDAQKQAVRDALARFSAVLNLSFTELADGAAADLSFYMDDLRSVGLGAAEGYAEPSTGAIHINSELYAATRPTETGEQVTLGSLAVGSSGFEVLLHEIGHALGLKHPFEPPVLPNAENSTANTVMSYTASGAPATALAAFDVAALQFLYGVNTSIRADDSTYSFSQRWIQDAGGTDAFTVGATTQAAYINLMPGSWSYLGSKATSILADNQSFIGFGSIIENATGSDGNDTIIGNDAQNFLRGGNGADVLRGGRGNDTLSGNSGDDFLSGDEGDDALQGSSGSDTYLWGAGFGMDVISESGGATAGTDTLCIAPGLTPADVVLRRSGDDLVIQSRTAPDSITVRSHFTGAGIERITFDDGTQWDANTILENVAIDLTELSDYFQGSSINETLDGKGGNDTLLGGAGNDTIAGGTGDDRLLGEDGNDVVTGGSGNDTLFGGADDDVLSGGEGNDFFYPGAGSDIYEFGRGDGVDTLASDYPLDRTTIRFGTGVAPADIVVTSDSRVGGDLTFSIAGTGDSFTIRSFFTWAESDNYIDQLKVNFADGTIWSGAQIIQRLYAGTPGADYLVARPTGSAITGGEGSDTLVGGVGNDTLDGGTGYDSLVGGSGDDTLINGDVMDGGAGNDTFVVNGSATIRDSGGADAVRLPTGATPANVKVLNGLDYAMYLEYFTGDSTASIRFDNYFKDTPETRVEEFRFADGTIWSFADIVARAKINNLTEGDDNYWVHGFAWADNISAKGGNDYVHGLGGNDTIDGGSGNDTLYGEVGNDSLVGGAGDDELNGDDADLVAVGNDSLDGGAGNDTLSGGKGDDVYTFGRGYGYDIVTDDGGSDRIVLAAGIVPANVSLFRDSDDLVLMLDGSRVQMRVTGHFGTSANRQVEAIVFADGTVWDQAYVTANASGSGVANQLTGTSGNDSFVVDHTGDWINEGANQGIDSVTSSTSYALPDNVENLTLTGNLNLWAKGNALANLIIGNAGDNRLTSNRGSDTLKGGAGDDYYDITVGPYITSQSLVTVVENANEGIDTVRVDNYDYTLPDNVENMIAGSAWTTVYAGDNSVIPRYLTGNALNNLIDASAELYGLGTRLDGGLGADTLIGGIRDNIYIVDNSLDVLIEPTNGGVDTVEASVSWTLAAEFENLKLASGAGAISGTGNAANNTLDGSANSSANVLTGGAGNDTYVMGAGDTAIENADAGVDTVVLRTGVVGTYRVADFANIENLSLGANMGASTILGGSGSETLVGNGLRNLISAGVGDDVLFDQATARYPEEYADTLLGGDGADTLTSQAGADWLEGGQGDDRLIVNGASTSTAAVTVRFSRGDGADILGGSRAAIISVGGWTAWDLKVVSQASGYVLSFGIGADSITVQYATQPVRLVFDDGTTISETALASMLANPTGLPTSAADFLRGTAGADALSGLAGDDTILSGAGDDTITGGDGNDSLLGGDGLDVLQGGTGDDTLDGQAGNDVYKFARGDGADTVGGAASDGSSDELQFAAGILPSDVVATRSGSADLRLAISGSADSVLIRGLLNQGASLQLVRFADGTVWDRALLLNKLTTLTGTAGADTLTGGASDDKIYGLDGSDRLYGLGGNDTLDGGAGADVLYGGAGDDTYVVDSSSDIVAEYAGEGVDTVLSSVTYALPGNVENLTLTGSASEEATGNSGDNVLTGNSGANYLIGGGGTDTLIGGAGDDLYEVDSVGDVVIETAGEGVDEVESSISYTLTAEVEILTLTGSASINGTGNSLSNRLTGNAGANRLDGGAGDDTMVGGAGNDTYVVDSLLDVVTELANGGTDTVESSISLALMAQVENLTLTGNANINATGNGLANTLRGNVGNNTLDGGAGNDTMIGGAGDDVYVVDATTDVVTESADAGMDTIQTSVTLASLAANVENLTLTGSSNLNATGNALNNMLTGNAGANRIDGGTGADTMVGGAGNDTYVVDSAGDVIAELAGGGTDTVEAGVSYTLGAELENLTLTGTGAFDATGNDLANKLTGNSGNNRLNGGAGNDTMVGGAGNDTYVVESLSDVVTEAASGGVDTIESSITLTLVAEVENLTLTGTSNINATGNSVANTLRGNAGNNTLNGGAGNDTMIGGAGDDIYVLDVATDVVTENLSEGNDTIQIGVTLTTLAANVENVTLTGTSNINATGNGLANVLTGNSGANNLSGGDGDDTLDGGAGVDTLVGGLGNDVFYVDSASDVVTEASAQGTDTIMTSVTLSSLAANVENLTLIGTGNINGTGNSGDNVMTGNAGNNTLTGAAGNDMLDGKAGNDTLNGGAGADTYLFGIGYGADVIVDSDSTANVKDVVKFGAGIAQADIRFTQSGNSLVATIKSTSESLTIQDWYLSANNRVEEFRFNDGTVLTNVQAQALVGAMAAFKPSAGALTADAGQEQHFARAIGLAVAGTV